MRKKLIMVVALMLAFLFSVLHANEKKINLELNNEVVLTAGDVLNVSGTTYVDAEKLSRLMDFDFFSFSGGESLVFRTLKDEKEYFLYFKPMEMKKNDTLPIINRGGERNLDLDLKSIDYMTTEMYDRLEEQEKQEKKAEARLELLKKDYQRVVEEAHYITKEEKTYVPIKDISRILGFNLQWDARSSSVLLYTKPLEELPKRKVHRLRFSEEDVMLLAKIATVEAGGASENKLLAVCNVVLNRVENGSFPNTIQAVIYQPNQFPPAYYSSFGGMKPEPKAINAAYRALYGENNVPRVLYFNMEPFESKDESELFGIIEGDYFYY